MHAAPHYRSFLIGNSALVLRACNLHDVVHERIYRVSREMSVYHLFKQEIMPK
jgi:hypothetical protein